MQMNQQNRLDLIEALELWKQEQIRKAPMKGLAVVLMIDMRKQALLELIGVDVHRGELHPLCPF